MNTRSVIAAAYALDTVLDMHKLVMEFDQRLGPKEVEMITKELTVHFNVGIGNDSAKEAYKIYLKKAIAAEFERIRERAKLIADRQLADAEGELIRATKE